MYLAQGTLLKNGEYKINQMLDQGGFGITYLAEQVNLHREVVIKEFFMKELNERNSESGTVTTPSVGGAKLVEQYRNKFIKEAHKLATLKHPNIVQIIDVFEENGTVYYVMPFFSDGSLSERIKSHGPYDEAEAMNIIRPIAEALHYMHSKKKMCHYDVKPANILLNENGSPILIDFGISKNYDAVGKQTSSTPIGLSEGYAPIEQYQGKVQEFSPESDVYALGATLYYLLTGKRPPTAIDRVSGEQLDLPATYSPAMRQLVESSMTIARQDRPSTTEVFLLGDVAQTNEETFVCPEEGNISSQAVNFEPDKKTKKPQKPKKPKKSIPWRKYAIIIVALLIVTGAVSWWLDKKSMESADGLTGQALEYHKNALNGDAAAQYELAKCYIYGLSAPLDSAKAVYWASKSNSDEFPMGTYLLAVLYQKGIGVKQNQTEADKFFAKAYDAALPLAKNGDPRAQYVMGQLHANGNCHDSNTDEALTWTIASAGQGFAEAQFKAGLLYYQLENNNHNHRISYDQLPLEVKRRFMREMIEDGKLSWGSSYNEIDSVYRNECIKNTEKNTEKDPKIAVYWFNESAKQGNVFAQHFMGVCYLNGFGVEVNGDKYLEWTSRAAEQGLADAQYNLGMSYLKGNHVTLDYGKAIDWLSKAANKGNASAKCKLGYCYLNGIGVKKNRDKGIALYRQAARLGDKNAMVNLGNMGLSW